MCDDGVAFSADHWLGARSDRCYVVIGIIIGSILGHQQLSPSLNFRMLHTDVDLWTSAKIDPRIFVTAFEIQFPFSGEARMIVVCSMHSMQGRESITVRSIF